MVCPKKNVRRYRDTQLNSGTIVVNLVDAQLGNHGDTQQKNIPYDSTGSDMVWPGKKRRNHGNTTNPHELYSYIHIYIFFSIVATVMGFIFTVTSLWATTMVCLHSWNQGIRFGDFCRLLLQYMESFWLFDASFWVNYNNLTVLLHWHDG